MTDLAGRGSGAWAARLVEWLRSAPDTAAALVVANLLPLIGVVALGWDLMMILVLYWLESGVIGLLNLPKIVLARGPLVVPMGRARFSAPPLTGWRRTLAVTFAIPFFVVHYGMFWLGHGLFVFLLPAMTGDASALESVTDPFELAGVDPTAVLVAAGVLFASHTLSFARNYVGRREYESVSPSGQMARPYTRVVVMHLSILGGGFLSLSLGTPAGALVILVILKTALDLRAHLREHANRSPT